MSYLEFFDTAMRAADCTDGILKYMQDYTAEADFETGYYTAALHNADAYEAIGRLFTGQGFGGKLQVDFTENEEQYVTLGRFNPMADTISVKRGEVIKSEYDAVYCSPYYYIKMNDARGFMHQLAGFGHHQVLIFGDYTKMLHQIGEVMGFKVLEHK